VAPRGLHITGDPAADELLNTDGLALLIGMLLDQQVSMEWAFRAPFTLRDRLGGTLDARAIVDAGPEALVEVFCAKPALHRYPAVMANRAYELCRVVVDRYDGDATKIWKRVRSGEELYRRVRELPGFGEEKAKIFVALLAKRRGVKPAGWEQYAGAFADDTPRSAADVDGPATLERVREWKRIQKKAGRSKQD